MVGSTTKLIPVLIVSLILAGCSVPSFSQQPSSKLINGFWYWQGANSDAAWSDKPLDVLFVQVGTINADPSRGEIRWSAYGEWPSDMPPANDYWIVYRFNRQGVPDVKAVPILAQQVSRLLSEAQRRKLRVAGIQLDIDSPTSALSQYAKFLHEVRGTLPSGTAISITALLDWFRDGTAIDKVIRQVDEFVPQFYDLGDPRSYTQAFIAAPVDSARWGPIFNRFQKPFRIGISSFGRARVIPVSGTSPGQRYPGVSLFGDLGLMDVATNPAFTAEIAHDPANELVLTYRAARLVTIGYSRFAPGDAIQFILATPDSVRAAAGRVREMGGYLAGLIFFRWPASNETLAMQPEEVLSAAGIAPQHPTNYRVEVVNGHCAAVECVDLYLEGADPFSAKTSRYLIRSSTDFEYFLPEKNLPVRMTGSSQLELSLPPYCGRGRLYLGRAVTAAKSHYTAEAE